MTAQTPSEPCKHWTTCIPKDGITLESTIQGCPYCRIESLQAEVERLTQLCAIHYERGAAENQRAESAERKLAEAVAALMKYGEHKQHCALYIGLPKMKCSCGFDEAMK